MTPLELARGPLLKAAVSWFVVGVTWRLASLLLKRKSPDPSAPRPGAPSALAGAAYTIIRRSWHNREFHEQAAIPNIVAHTFHIGLLIIVALGTPHILFWADIVGFRWPGLPKGIIDVVSGITLAALLFALWRRVHHPVRRHLSDANDYFTWLVTALPVVTGLLLTSGLGARYETMLALHIMSFELLLAWVPFGKLMHAFLWVFSRGTTGARFAHRGART